MLLLLCRNGAVNLENQYNVTLGDYNICNANEPTRKKFTVSSAKVHPKFRRASSGFDIAIVCLSEAAEGYTPVCLPEKNSGKVALQITTTVNLTF